MNTQIAGHGTSQASIIKNKDSSDVIGKQSVVEAAEVASQVNSSKSVKVGRARKPKEGQDYSSSEPSKKKDHVSKKGTECNTSASISKKKAVPLPSKTVSTPRKKAATLPPKTVTPLRKKSATSSSKVDSDQKKKY
eukprot:13659-Ditylum_brightwellii.AAC.1